MITIAIIEDDPAISQMYRMKFESEADFDVFLAGDGDQGLKLVKEVEPDIVLLDLMMPGKDGVETLAEIRAVPELGAIPVIILTNRELSQVPPQLENLNVTDYIVKANLTPSEVVAKVKRLFN